MSFVSTKVMLVSCFITGFLFRCFMNLYNCELVCEDAFLSWKEEVNPSYPAKGQALFEVHCLSC